MSNIENDAISACRFYIDKLLGDPNLSGMKVLLLDMVTTRTISMVYSQTQILSKEVYLVEHLSKDEVEAEDAEIEQAVEEAEAAEGVQHGDELVHNLDDEVEDVYPSGSEGAQAADDLVDGLAQGNGGHFARREFRKHSQGSSRCKVSTPSISQESSILVVYFPRREETRTILSGPNARLVSWKFLHEGTSRVSIIFG